MRILQLVCLGFLFSIASLLYPLTIFALIPNGLQDTLQKYGISYQEQNYIGNTVSIDLSSLEEILQESFSNTPLEYEWDTYGQGTQTGIQYSTTFETSGEKLVQLSIYSQDEGQKTLLHRSDIPVFIYEKSIPLIVSSTVTEKDIDNFIQSGKDIGVYVKFLGQFEENKISGTKIIQEIQDYQLSFPESSDYFMIWGEKEFLFSTLSQIHTGNTDIESLNFVLVSSYNSSILQKYISNSIAGKIFIKNAFIIDESVKFQVLKNPKSILNLKKEIQENGYTYTPISGGENIAPYFFASRFVNMLSNMGIPNSDIYIILLLPLFLTAVGFAKHMIGLSSLGNIIPVFIALLFIKIGIILTLSLMAFLLIFNIIISRFFSKYTLLYTPKVSSITILNLLVFMGIIQALQNFNIINVALDNVLYIAIFFVIAEKMITIITSKEFREYKRSLSGTVIISAISYLMYSFDALRVFLMAYPETLILFVPLNFFLGRFTGLRITEYLRFKEIIKSIEE